jgi:DNA-binding NtrC family response regulator
MTNLGADILIVDDEADIRKLIRGILEDEGYKTRSAPVPSRLMRKLRKIARI